MPHARLHVDLPDGPWIAAVSREFPDAEFRVLAAMPGDDAGFALVHVVHPDIDAVLAAMEAHPTLTSLSVMATDEGEATVQFETSSPTLLAAARQAAIPIEMPVQIADGTATIDVTGEHERIADLGNRFREMGLGFEVEFVQRRANPSRLLSDRQLDALLTAVEVGYYEVPREGSLATVAERLGVAKSTCSETLSRAERTVVSAFVDDLPPRVTDERGTGDCPVAREDGAVE